jgi:hypothetical protein
MRRVVHGVIDSRSERVRLTWPAFRTDRRDGRAGGPSGTPAAPVGMIAIDFSSEPSVA